MQRCFLVVALFASAVTVSAATDSATGQAEVLAFDLQPVTNSWRAGAFEVSLGPENGDNAQRISLLAALYTNSDKMMEIPIASLCSSNGDWNRISQPQTGAVIVTGAETGSDESDGDGMVLVQWTPTMLSEDDANLKLTLRKGRADFARNVSIINGGSTSNVLETV